MSIGSISSSTGKIKSTILISIRFGFRGTLLTTASGVPVDFAIASADRDDRDVLPFLVESGEYPDDSWR